ncbi:MAG: glycine--tRNA ligase [Pedosphaera sp.]|nr:glycine--tRNA ligase [Pedosphaera sp.]
MADPKVNESMEKLVSLCKRRGFIFQSSEIYGGINGFWDYGPLGAELKRNVKDLWWRTMVHHRDDVVGLEATIIMHPAIWKASGHVDTFADMMRECPLTKKRVRADQVDPLSGTILRYTGAELPGEGGRIETPVTVLMIKGDYVETVRNRARQLYVAAGNDKSADPAQVKLLGETTILVENSTDFHPDSRVELTEPRPFNLMLQTYVGPIQSEENIAYLRPETAQAIFAQFKNVTETSRQKVPFGVAQTGKAFRNEVTPRNYIFRSREFEQMELEFFIRPDEAVEALAGSVARASDGGWQGEPQSNWGWEVWHKYWVEQRIRFYEGIGLPRLVFEEYWQKPEELAHYARACVDILYKFPFGTQELEGIAARGDFDLTQHEKHSGKAMGVFDEELRGAWARLDAGVKSRMHAGFVAAKTEAFCKRGTPETDAQQQAETEAKTYFEKLAKGQFVPHVIEPSAGVDRLILALLCHAYTEVSETDDKGKVETRVLLRFHPKIAPVKVGVMPLLKNKPNLVKKALEVRDLLRPHMTVFYDDSGSIGRRYARQDEAGTPFCLTIDFDTLGEKPEMLDTVTLRHRDDGRQERIPISGLAERLLQWVR